MTYDNVQKALDALNVQHELTDDGGGLGIQWLQTGLMVGDYSLQIICPEEHYLVSNELLWSLQLFSFKKLEFLSVVNLPCDLDDREVALLALQLVFGTAARLKLPWKSCSKIEEVLQ